MAPRQSVCYRGDCLRDRVLGTWWCAVHRDSPEEPEAAHRPLVSLYRAICTLCSRGAWMTLDAQQAAAMPVARCACGGSTWLERDLGIAV